MSKKGSKTGIYKKCRQCHVKFYCFPFDVARRKFCSTKCFDKFASENGTKELRDYDRHSDVTRRKMRRAWTKERRKALSTAMQKGSPRQVQMQQLGNIQRRGKANGGAQEWWDSLSDAERRMRAENMSVQMSARYANCPNPGYVRGCQGWLTTRLGRIRYDSTWEREFISRAADDRRVKSLGRDFPVPYKWDGRWRTFLVDFRVEFRKQNPLLVEIKCPYFLDTRNTKAKIRAAKRYAKKHSMRFVLLASREEVEVTECLAS